MTLTRATNAATAPHDLTSGLGARWSALRCGALLALGVALVAAFVWFRPVAQSGAGSPQFGWALTTLTALYVAACALILRSQPADGVWRWVELGVIALIGLALRAVVFGAPPALSPDAYRYAWDPYVLAHGFSPYTHTPKSPELLGLRESAIFPNLRFRNAPTIYPPAAQAMFLLAYAVAPLNIFGVKAVIEICDALASLLTLALLRRRGLDLRRVMFYWWAPLPVIEFAFSGHVDAEAILWTLAALLVNEQRWRGSRVATGALLGLATLTKLYPLLFVIALVRRRDYGLLAGLLGMIALGYAPFVWLGLGSGGFLGQYLSQRWVDQGLLVSWLDSALAGLTTAPTALVIADFVALALLSGLIALYRWRLGLDSVACVLALSVAWILLSPHIFPWYLAALLPLIALSRGQGAAWGERLLTPTAWACWTFTLLVPYTYILFLPDGASGLFPWMFALAAAVGLAPLLDTRTRASALLALRRLFAAPTLAECAQLWRSQPSPEGGDHR
ncbi:MAG TPA: glycosyltransferase 87 family protein [Ktedonobacterales bacterium]